MVREILEVRDALVQRAHQHGQPGLAFDLQRDARGSNVAMDRAADAVRRLEALGTPRPALQHAVELWFAPVLAKRLRAAQLGTVGALVTCCNSRGRGWWRRVPRVGALAAGVIVAWLHSHERTLGIALGAHVIGDMAALALPDARQPVTIDAGAIRLAPLEALRVIQHLDGSDGCNRGARERSTLSASNDYQAILSWLSLRPAGSHTWRAYRKESERFLLWAVVERGVALSSLRVEDCVAYRDFLADPHRLSEVCSARREKLRRAEDAESEIWELAIVGKRNKLRTVPVSARSVEALRAHWRDRGLDFDVVGEGPLLAPLVVLKTASAIAKAEAGRLGYSASGLHHLIERTSDRFARALREKGPESSRPTRVRAHALRHTFGVHSTEAEIPLDVTQQILGHASMATTTIYVQGDRKRRLREIGKLYGI